MTDISEWVDGLGYTEAMIEFENYWEEILHRYHK